MKPHSLCQALLVQELLLMMTGFVAEFSFCVPRAAMNVVVYFTLFLFIVVKTEQTIAGYIDTKRD